MERELSVCLFFTFGMNLRRWDDDGILEREGSLYRKLVEKGVDVAFFTYGDESELAYADRLPGINIIPAWSKGPSLSGKLGKLIASLTVPWVWKQELAKYRLMKTNQMWGTWVPLLTRQVTGRPVLLRCGYEAYRHILEEMPPWLIQRMVYWLSRWAYASSDRIVFSYDGALEFAANRFGLAREKVIIQPNYVDTSLFRPVISDRHYSRRVLFVGKLKRKKQKNLFSLIRAVAISKLGLDIVGQGPLEASLEAEARICDSDVRFLGNVPNQRLPQIMSRYPVFVLPSLYEGNPKVLLEAMSCGMAVVGTDVHGIRNIVKNEVTGLLCDTSCESLAMCIERLVCDKMLRKRLSAAARRYIVKNFSLDSIVAREIAIYQQLVREAFA